MASREDLLVSQAKHACFVALSGLNVFGDESMIEGEFRGVTDEQYGPPTLYSDTVWLERDGRKRRYRVRLRIDVDTEEI